MEHLWYAIGVRVCVCVCVELYNRLNSSLCVCVCVSMNCSEAEEVRFQEESMTISNAQEQELKETALIDPAMSVASVTSLPDHLLCMYVCVCVCLGE